MKKEIIKHEAKTMQVYDADNEKFVDITKEQQYLALSIHQQISRDVFKTALALKRMRDEKLYLGLSCQTFKDYLFNLSPISHGQAYKYLKIADKFHEYLPTFSKDQKSHGDTFEDMGMRKLYEISRLEDTAFEELKEHGTLLVEGKAYNIDDLKEMNIKDFEDEMKKLHDSSKKYQSRLAQVSEENKILASEKEIAEEKLRIAEDRIEQIKELEDKYGPPPTKLKDKRYALDTARLHLGEMEQYLFQCNIDDNDPENLQQDLVDFLKRIEKTIENARNIYSSAISIILRNNV